MKSIIFVNNIMLRYIVAKYNIKHGRQVANTAQLVAVVERVLGLRYIQGIWGVPPPLP